MNKALKNALQVTSFVTITIVLLPVVLLATPMMIYRQIVRERKLDKQQD